MNVYMLKLLATGRILHETRWQTYKKKSEARKNTEKKIHRQAKKNNFPLLLGQRVRTQIINLTARKNLKGLQQKKHVRACAMKSGEIPTGVRCTWKTDDPNNKKRKPQKLGEEAFTTKPIPQGYPIYGDTKKSTLRLLYIILTDEKKRK